MTEKNEKTLNEMVSLAVAYLMETHAPRPLSQGKLAKASGVSQGSICMNLRNERGWSLAVLERICKAFGVPPETVIALGREVANGGDPRLAARLASTPPRTMDRLDKIVQAVAPAGTAKEVLDMFYSSQMFALVAPEYVQRYVDGAVTDREVYELLDKAEREAPADGNLWGVVKAWLNPNGDGPYSPAPQK